MAILLGGAVCAQENGRYLQGSLSLPIESSSTGGEGHPYRALFGYPLKQWTRWVIHQDWVLSYHDAKPLGGADGGSGAGLGTDFIFQWRHRAGRALTPFYEFGAGVQYALGSPFPAHGSRFQFTNHAGVGLMIPTRQQQRMWLMQVRYLHMSNGGTSEDNAGYDALHFMLGLRWY